MSSFILRPRDGAHTGETTSALAAPAMQAAARHPIAIVPERPADIGARERLLDRAFGPARFAKPSHKLRHGRMPAGGLSLVAKRNGALVGTVRLWHVLAGDVPALLLGPLAVDASVRSHGIGAMLMAEAIARARAVGHGAVLLVGDAPYYARFGFVRAHTADLVMPGDVDPARFLGLELRPGELAGARGRVCATGAIDIAPRRRRRRRPIRAAATQVV